MLAEQIRAGVELEAANVAGMELQQIPAAIGQQCLGNIKVAEEHTGEEDALA